MNVYPLKQISLDEAKQLQFKLVDLITKYLKGSESLTLGDLGVNFEFNQPLFTHKTENIIAMFFDAQACILTTGSGTGALRMGLYALFAQNKNKKILVHKAPIYPTTLTTLKMLDAEIIEGDYNNLAELEAVVLHNPDLDKCLVQYSRQKPEDSYNYENVIKTLKNINPKLQIITDDNYAVMKVAHLGVHYGASLSTFSSFKVQGPQGVGVIVGNKVLIDLIRQENYSGGSQIQGYQASEVLHGMVIAPVMMAIQSNEVERTVRLINEMKLIQIKNCFVANAQSRVIIVEFHDAIAKKVLQSAEQLGALPNPIGAESKFEIVPMFYRCSSTFRSILKNAETNMIRINPNRASAETVIRILKESLQNVFK